MSKKETEFRRLPALKRKIEDDYPPSDSAQKKKLSFGLSKTLLKMDSKLKQNPKQGLKMKVSTTVTKREAVNPASKLGKPASAFADDDDDDEEMPPEAKMRMKNIGRDTPTSSGPNSFGKTKMGFCDVKKIFEKQISEDQPPKED